VLVVVKVMEMVMEIMAIFVSKMVHIMFYIPAALVLGCNNPISLNPLKDFIEEVTGIEPDFGQTGFSDGNSLDSNFGHGYVDGYSYNYDPSSSDGYGDGYGYNYGFGSGRGYGLGYGYGNSSGNGYGDGDGY